MKPILNSHNMTRYMHNVEGFERVLHVAHHEWHGIRQATSYCPGHKLLISADSNLDEADKSAISDIVEKLEVDRVVFQGYSENADQLLLYLKAQFGSDLRCYAITHVTTSQFEHYYEMIIQARLSIRKRYKVLDGLASVKPDFSFSFDEYWPGLIVNFAPNIPEGSFNGYSEITDVYTPLDPGWRKNMYTNIIAACLAYNVERVKTANYPNGLENFCDLNKMRIVGYLRGKDLYAEMANSSLVLLATLAECQPMTQLESFAVKTPAMTGRLNIKDFERDPLIQLCSTDKLDNPALLARDIENVIKFIRSDPAAMREMIDNHLVYRHELAVRRYKEFLEL